MVATGAGFSFFFGTISFAVLLKNPPMPARTPFSSSSGCGGGAAYFDCAGLTMGGGVGLTAGGCVTAMTGFGFAGGGFTVMIFGGGFGC